MLPTCLSAVATTQLPGTFSFGKRGKAKAVQSLGSGGHQILLEQTAGRSLVPVDEGSPAQHLEAVGDSSKEELSSCLSCSGPI